MWDLYLTVCHVFAVRISRRCYNSFDMEINRICIQRAEYAGNLRLHLFFSDGTDRIVDFEPFILDNPHPQHAKYLDPRFFMNFKIENGDVVWGNGWDMIFPIEQLYDGTLR